MKAKKVHGFELRNINTRLPSSVHSRKNTAASKPDKIYIRIEMLMKLINKVSFAFSRLVFNSPKYRKAKMYHS